MTAALQRDVFSITTAESYTSISGLQAQTGQEPNQWRHVALKELVDNALDAAESAGIAPVVAVDIVESTDGLVLSIADNGRGIPPDVVARLADFSAFLSDKAPYRAPLRGAQGNAVKTLLGMPVALSADKRSTTEIEACGVRHRLHVQVSPTGAARCEHEQEPAPTATGTRVTVRIPGPGDIYYWNPIRWIRAFALFNPHARLQIRENRATGTGADEIDGSMPGDSCLSDLSLPPTVPFPGKWRKFLPSDPTPAHWYRRDEFTRLVHLKAEQGRAAQSVGDFIKEFKGMSRVWRDVRKQVSAATLAELVENREIDTLHDAIRTHAKAPKPEVLGRVGPDHIRAGIDAAFTINGRFWYKHRYGTAAGMPYLIECAIAETRADGGVFYGLNFSVPFNDPLPDTLFTYTEGTEPVHKASGLRGFLSDLGAVTHTRYGMNTTTTVAVHLVMPLLPSLDRGKSRLALPAVLSAAIAETIGTAAGALHKAMVTARKNQRRLEQQQRSEMVRVMQTAEQEQARQQREVERQQREAERAEKQAARDAEAEKRRARCELPYMRAVLFELLLPVYMDATDNETIRISQRDLFYAIRPAFEARPVRPSRRRGEYSTDLEFGYFTKVVAEFRKVSHPLPYIDRKARGTLFEPYSGREIALGDRELREYRFPHDDYQGILFIEKEGVWQTLRDTGGLDLMRRYGLMVLASEGYSTEAVRQFFALAQNQHGYRILAWHDADPDGMNIARTLAEPTELMPDHRLEVIDIGLTLAEGEAMGLPFETYIRKEPLPQTLVPTLDSRTLSLFAGDEYVSESDDPKSKPKREWRNCKRIEINAIKAQQRPAWLEAKLADALRQPAHDATRPALADMLATAANQARTELEHRVRTELERRIDTESLIAHVMTAIGTIDTTEAVTTALQQDEKAPWRAVVKSAVVSRINADTTLESAITDLVARAIRAAIEP